MFESSGSYNWDVPSGVDHVYVSMVGGGGAGASGAGYGCGGQGGGGSGAAYLRKLVGGLTTGQSISIIVGQGGKSSSQNGTSSSFGNYLICPGGQGGTGYGGSSGGFGGQNGQWSYWNLATVGIGGGNFFGDGGKSTGTVGADGSGYGSGGSSGYATSAGGHGADGMVMIEW